ncbi:MAG: hypothetical protein JRI45_08260 [Deltaproteobacteria bacterium]|nr:hypothetical protein [Deltaproteobacteria bacterium]MBW2069164.1 hypothetical protein [Deltaproteobacteria bacterium]
MPHHVEDQRYRVSGVNRNLLQKGGLIGAVLLIAGVLAFLSLPTRYYYVYKDGMLSLCVGRIGWLDGSKEKTFEPVYLGEKADAELQQILEMKFKNKEEALEALQPYIVKRVNRHISEIANMEQKLFEHYHVLLGECIAAKQSGLEGFDESIETLKLWLKMFSEHQEVIKTHSEKSEQEKQSSEEAESASAKKPETKETKKTAKSVEHH